VEGEEELRPKNALTVSVESDINGKLTIHLPDGTTLAWPNELVPEDASGGGPAFLELVTPAVLEHRKKDLAREVLLQILNIREEE